MANLFLFSPCPNSLSNPTSASPFFRLIFLEEEEEEEEKTKILDNFPV